MDNTSYFIENKALFGCYPTEKDVDELEKEGVSFFIDLTFETEKRIKRYKTNKTYINFPIKDRKQPYNTEKYCIFINSTISIINNLKDNEKIYIHCRAGHSRSSMVVSTLLKLMLNISVEDSINLTKEYHNKRKNLKSKWLKLNHQTPSQKKFLYNIFSNKYFFRAYKDKSPTFGFSTYSNHPIEIPNIGTFQNCQIAFYALQYKHDKLYLEKQLKSQSAYESKKLYKSMVNNISDKNKRDLMEYIVNMKLKQYPIIKEKLVETGFQSLIYTNKYDYFFGIGINNSGSNILGKILMEIRNNYYKDKIFYYNK